MSVKKSKKSKKWLIFLILAIIVAAVFLFWQLLLAGRQVDPLANIRSTEAKTGSIEKTVTGTGNLKAEEEFETITVVDGLVIDEILVEPGDVIAAGDTLATFDAQVLQSAIWNTQAELNNLDTRLNQLIDKTESQYISTVVAGRIKQIFIAEGDDVQTIMTRHGALMILSLDGKLQLTITAAANVSPAAGDKVTVTLSGGDTLEGTVRTAAGSAVTITISDRNASVGDQVSVSLDGEALGSGTLAISQPLAITATGGTAGDLLFDLNARVSSGARLIKLTEAPVSQTYLQLYAQRQDLADRLATLLGYVRDGGLLSEISGEMRSINLVEGLMTGSSANAGSTPAPFTVRTGNDIQLTIHVDELDIAALAIGQNARITLDALPSLSLSGSILEIAESGAVGQSGSTFAVSLSLPANGNLKPGMTSTAVITVDQRDNIIMIPLEALQESGGEQYVYVGTAVSTTEPGEKRLVKTGISDGEFVEIVSGLADNENINYYFASGEDTRFPFQGGNFSRPGTTTAD